MKLFILLVFTFCSCQAVPFEGEDADCDDPDVFRAVDLAVKAHNEDQKDGNLFALRVILAARRTAGPGKNFHIKYQLTETSCPLRGSVSWQNCEFLPPSEGDSGECSAEIHTNDNLVYSSVFQTCKIVTAPGKVTRSHAGCLGCWHSISRKSPELIPIVTHGVELFNNESGEINLFDAVSVIAAARQVVAGWNYKFDYWLKETNCSKADFSHLTPECKIVPAGHTSTCHVKSYVDFTNKIVNTDQNCKLEVDTREICPGCPRSIPPDSPQLKEPLEATVDKYNEESAHEFLYRITNVTKATIQIVAGIMYRIEFEIRKTNCSKAAVHELTDNCTVTDRSETEACHASVWERPWLHKTGTSVTVKCTNKVSIQAFLRRPPGFTPFRKAQMIAQVTSTGEGLSDTQKPERGRGHKHGHKKTKLRSSEESQEDTKKENEILPTAATSDPLEQEDVVTRNPNEDFVGFPSQDSTVPSFSLFERLPDLPEPPSPKCPGKPWKPIILPTTSLPDTRDFMLEDLLPGEGDMAEPQETTPAFIQPNYEEFDLADALS